MAVSLVKPVVGGSGGTWGAIVNAALDAVAGEINGHEVGTDPHGDRAYAQSLEVLWS